MSGSQTVTKTKQKKWYEKYLPFVARGPEMQIEWLASAFRKKILTHEEITPYIKLLLSDLSEEHTEQLEEIFTVLESTVVEQMVLAADIYDTPKLFSLIHDPTVAQAVIALLKAPPSYEASPLLLLDKVYQSIHEASDGLLEEAATKLGSRNTVPKHFEEAYARYQEILEDQRVLSSLYPKAR